MLMPPNPSIRAPNMQDRNSLEDVLPESEWHHRYAHALLSPLNLYRCWTEEEAGALDPELMIDFGRGKVAKFELRNIVKQTTDGSTPTPMWMYVLVSVNESTLKKKK